MVSVLICDNNPIFANYLKNEVEQLITVPCRVSVCHSSEELRQQCISNPPNIALMDIHLGDSAENGITLARENACRIARDAEELCRTKETPAPTR